MKLSMKPSRVVKVLGGAICVLVVFYLIGQFAGHFMGHGRLLGFTYQFNLNAEPNIATAFSSLLLFSSALLLGVIATYAWQNDAPFRRHWAGLALIFAYLGIDEYAMLHESLTVPMRDYLNPEGLLYYAWVVPAMGLLALFAVVYARFFWHLSPRWKGLFAASGLLYVSGALGVEMLGGWFAAQVGDEIFAYDLFVAAEEGLEMTGASVFLYTLLEYLRVHDMKVQISVEKDQTVTTASEQGLR